MSASRAVGWLLFLIGLAITGYGLALLVVNDGLPTGPVAEPVAAGASLGAGLVLLAVGLLAITRTTKPAAPPPAPPPAPVETVEIKRTPMDWGGAASGSQDAPGDSRLEALQARIAQVKVQYGLGEVSKEAYARIMKDLEAEAAELEAARFQGGRA